MSSSAGKVISAMFDLGLAAAFLITWTDPHAAQARSVGLLVLLMLLEFITVHSSAMLGSVWVSVEPQAHRLRKIGLLTAMYASFVGAFSAAFDTWAPFVGFWLLSANRLAGMLLGGQPGPAAKREAERSWARSVVLFLVGAVATTFFPVARLGLTPEVMAGIDIAGSGLWVEEPWRVLAFGTGYFGLSGLLLLLDVVRRESNDSNEPASRDAATAAMSAD